MELETGECKEFCGRAVAWSCARRSNFCARNRERRDEPVLELAASLCRVEVHEVRFDPRYDDEIVCTLSIDAALSKGGGLRRLR